MPTTGTMRYLKIGDATYEVYNTDNDTKVTQSYKTASEYTYWRPLVIGYSSGSAETFTPADQTNLTYTFNTLKVQPSTGTIRVGNLVLYNGNYTATLTPGTLSANRTITIPNKAGTMALTSDITSAIADLPEPMLFKGSVGTNGTITSLPAAAAANEGFTYKVITALTTPVTAKVGDTVISNGSEWVVIPSGDEPSGTVTSVAAANATNGGLTISGSPITSSGTITIGHSNVLTNAQTTQAVYPIKIDKNGHISAYGNAITIPSDIVSGSGSANRLTIWSDTNTLSSSSSLSISTSYNSSSDLYGKIKLYVGSTGQLDWQGQLVFYSGNTSKTITITPPSLATGSRIITLPDKDGTVALTSDIPTVPSNIVNKITTTAGTHTVISNQTGNVSFNVPTKTSHLTNDSNFVATTKSGAYDILTVGTGTYTGQIKIKKDYNDATFYTTIDVSHTANRTLTLPNASGTVALTSDIPTVPSNIVNTITTTAGAHTPASYKGDVEFNIPTKTSHLTNDSGFVTTDTNTTYALSGALSSHKFTSTLTASGSGSGTSTSDFTLAAGTGITITDDTSNRKMTIGCSVTNTDTKVSTAAVTSGTTYYPVLGSDTTSAESKFYDKTGISYLGTSGGNSTNGIATLTLGNNVSGGGGKYGKLTIYSAGQYGATLKTGSTFLANRTFDLPDKSGTIALTGDLNNYILKPSNDDIANYSWVLSYGNGWQPTSAFQIVVIPNFDAQSNLPDGTYYCMTSTELIENAYMDNCTLELRIDLPVSSSSDELITNVLTDYYYRMIQYPDESDYYGVIEFTGIIGKIGANQKRIICRIYIDENEGVHTNGEVTVDIIEAQLNTSRIIVEGTDSMNAVSCSAGGWATIGSITLTAGTWVVNCRARFTPTASGTNYSAVCFGSSTGQGWYDRRYSESAYQIQHSFVQIVSTSGGTYYLRGTCNNAGKFERSNGAAYSIDAVRIAMNT